MIKIGQQSKERDCQDSCWTESKSRWNEELIEPMQNAVGTFALKCEHVFVYEGVASGGTLAVAAIKSSEFLAH